MRFLLTILICFTCLFAFAQKGKKSNSTSKSVSTTKLSKSLHGKTLLISAGNAAISMPPTSINGIMHPMVEVGFSKPFKKNSTRQRLSVGTDIGYFNQTGLQSGVYLKPNITYNIPIYKSFSIVPKLGAGLLVANNFNNEFSLQSNGTYKQLGNIHPQFIGTLGLQPTVGVYKSNKFKYSVFASYEFAAQTPFSVISSLLPITMMRLGLKVQPSQNSTSTTNPQ